jgi:hypothetical protein
MNPKSRMSMKLPFRDMLESNMDDANESDKSYKRAQTMVMVEDSRSTKIK